MKTLAYEIAEQLGWQSPDWVVTPVGGGSLVIGLWEGFEEMRAAVLVGKTPRLAGVQAAGCASVYQTWRSQLLDVPGVKKRAMIAEGIAIARPVKGRDILAAVRGSGDTVVAVKDEDIWAALAGLGAAGAYVEPTGAVAAAAMKYLRRDRWVIPGERIVLILTGNGLKATDKINEHFAGDGHHSQTSKPEGI
jgi:threonine synthase